MKYVVYDGKRIPWRDVLALRREQRKHERQPHPALFELKHDVRSDRDPAVRYFEPSQFDEVQS